MNIEIIIDDQKVDTVRTLWKTTFPELAENTDAEIDAHMKTKIIEYFTNILCSTEKRIKLKTLSLTDAENII